MIKGAVSRPIFTAVVFVILLIIGGVSFKNLPVDIYPDIELPQISVLTLYPGASSENVEKLITKPLEDVLGNIQNLKEINSTSMENVSVVTLTFEYGTDLTEAVNDVRDAIDLAAFALPRDAEKPRIL
ncbi:MAG TPA: efflux RND transporter permease subunit, partial [candidate division WOR-3 bacterium]|nr:efflux RND transporter permease subunit [candidate division WOR-3 bacterium]